MTFTVTRTVKTYATVAAALLLAVAAAYLTLGGGYDRWAGQRVLDSACDGVLAADETRAVLGDGPLAQAKAGTREEDRDAAADGPFFVRCEVSRVVEYNAGHPTHPGSVEVTIHGIPTPSATAATGDTGDTVAARDDRIFWGTQTPRPVPLGHGWNGFFGAEPGAKKWSATAVLLECPAARRSLLVTATVEVDGTTVENPHDRTRAAQVATATARKAAGRWDCGAPLGSRPDTVPLPVNAEEYVPLSAAKGTCAGVPGPSRTGSVGWESTRGASPLEQCGVSGPSTTIEPEYELRAYYGVYARDMRVRVEERPTGPEGLVMTADCPSVAGRAMYVMRSSPVEKNATSPYARSALKAFAARSAKAHGCAAPVDHTVTP
ncbi:hypothetical protein ACWGI8_29875 [Streptomyces sp. NPDC054841]